MWFTIFALRSKSAYLLCTYVMSSSPADLCFFIMAISTSKDLFVSLFFFLIASPVSFPFWILGSIRDGLPFKNNWIATWLGVTVVCASFIFRIIPKSSDQSLHSLFCYRVSYIIIPIISHHLSRLTFHIASKTSTPFFNVVLLKDSILYWALYLSSRLLISAVISNIYCFRRPL